MRGQAITIEDVARAAGVSRQTVSRVINDQPSVKPHVRERVRQAIDSLGYVPNLSARRMAGARSYLIMAINDRQRTIENWRAGRGNDWVDQMLHGGMLACEARGYHMVFELVDSDPDLAPRQLSKILSSLRPDGIILTQPHSANEGLIRLLEDKGTRFALIGNPDRPGTLSVGMDEELAARTAVRHLVELGHRRTAFLAGSPEYGSSARRRTGYEAEALAHGVEPMTAIGGFHFDQAATISRTWLTSGDPPTAIITENDEMAFAVLHVADRLGFTVPENVSLLTLEDTPGVRFSIPPLTAIRQPTAQIIARACDLLISEAEGKTVERRHLIPFDLVVRETTARA